LTNDYTVHSYIFTAAYRYEVSGVFLMGFSGQMHLRSRTKSALLASIFIKQNLRPATALDFRRFSKFHRLIYSTQCKQHIATCVINPSICLSVYR